MLRKWYTKGLAAGLSAVYIVSLVGCGTNNTASVQGDTTTQDQTVTQEETTENNTTAEEATDPDVIGVSTTGYAIKEIDGLTYVGGVLIVNKTYGLPSSYAPGDLTDEVKEAFAQMQAAAAAEGLNIYISSGYRSYNYQVNVYNSYVSKDGKALADTYSARPGYSEHQTGLCFDLNSIDESFGDTAEGKWVAEHAYEYGFIVRFPEGKEDVTGYEYEPWHLRYLGVDMATAVYNSGLSLEEYLGITSEYVD